MGGGTTGGTSEEVQIIESSDVCDVQPIFENNSCITCHQPSNALGGLDLVSAGLEQRLVDAPSNVNGCNRLLIDSQNPSRSMLLQVLGAGEVAHAGSSCDLPMPPVGFENNMTDDERECLTVWVEDLAAQVADQQTEENTPATVESALRKVKTLIHGGYITQEEIDQANANGIEYVIETWTQSEAFEDKILGFFKVALQQKFETNSRNQFGRLQSKRNKRLTLFKVLEEVIPRTALHMIQNDYDFSEIATTNNWMMSTEALVALAFPDQSENQKAQRHFVSGNSEDVPNALRQKIRQRKWYVPGLEGTCDLRQSDIFSMFLGLLPRQRCESLNRNFSFNETLLTDEDASDWRLVEVITNRGASDEDLTPFYDVRTLRNVTSITTRIPRWGFYTSSAFLNQWPTNVDNEFRVTVNQALITGLHSQFRATDPTPSQNTEAVSEEHASAGEDCNGCHRLLDPMRVYFAQGYNADYKLPTDEDGQEALFNRAPRASFSYRGFTNNGGRVSRLGQNIANHPLFATAWVQKVCLFANSSPCDEEDETFIAIRDRFVDQGYRFLPMLIEVLSSTLVSGTIINDQGSTPIISITRRDHLCGLLSQRLNDPQICKRQRVQSILGLIPSDSYVRGAADFTQPALSSAFSFAAAQGTCESIATNAVTANSELLPVNDAESSINRMVTQLMSIPESNERYRRTIDAFTQHYQEMRDSGVNPTNSLRSVFVIACLSPDVMGVGL